MTSQDVLALADKVKNGTSSPEEELELLKYLNQGVEELRVFVRDIMTKSN